MLYCVFHKEALPHITSSQEEEGVHHGQSSQGERQSLHRFLLKYTVNCPVLLLSLKRLFQGCFVVVVFPYSCALEKEYYRIG